jgi:hypothetical protein
LDICNKKLKLAGIYREGELALRILGTAWGIEHLAFA